jgi:hypothetical protein
MSELGNRRYWEVGRLLDSFKVLLLKVLDKPTGNKKPLSHDY